MAKTGSASRTQLAVLWRQRNRPDRGPRRPPGSGMSSRRAEPASSAGLGAPAP
jgi:hypothetical protein